MSLLGSLDSRFAVHAFEPAATDTEIERLVEFAKFQGQTLPDDYLKVLREATEVEILVNHRACFRLWSPEGVIEMNEAHDLQKYIPDGIAVGDDQGGLVFVIMTGREGPGLYRLSFSDPDREDAVFVAASLAELLERGVGIDRLFAWEDSS